MSYPKVFNEMNGRLAALEKGQARLLAAIESLSANIGVGEPVEFTGELEATVEISKEGLLTIPNMTEELAEAVLKYLDDQVPFEEPETPEEEAQRVNWNSRAQAGEGLPGDPDPEAEAESKPDEEAAAEEEPKKKGKAK